MAFQSLSYGGGGSIFIGRDTKDIVWVKPFARFSSVPPSFRKLFVSGLSSIDTWVATFDMLGKYSESEEGLEALLGSTLEDGKIQA